MPQDTTVTINKDGTVIVVYSSKDSIDQEVERALQQYQLQQPNQQHEVSDQGTPVIVPLAIIACMALVIYKLNNWLQPTIERISGRYFDEEEAPETTAPEPKALVYNGDGLQFTDAELEKVLDKYIVYFTRLDFGGRIKFLQRLKKFIDQKVFVIHDESGFREMPILISAAAVQISFGLDKYLLPNFSHIHIFPDAFIGVYPTLRLLEGNVSGHTVNLSWKHFMDGYKYPENGQNVGLHEFAHAYYYQYFETGENVERDFVATFPKFDEWGNRAFQQEQLPGNDLYSDYALTNFQEFWAESVEIFFERPADMKRIYLDLYNAMCELLNQNPVSTNSTFS